ncbi:hypothetical protein [Sutcliffiella sp. NC1]|uniref:hypothetical protein n=1 Tax=Sutcliffiella sp. NC1 TaxID=3004096 RepID=UPI0022DE0411|nr:hypothetical protein [Sutcliffiella sp. NC1]WBL14311.1 hypothetical protein O1A01_20885 [Sutcliffiella sp. NC1]
MHKWWKQFQLENKFIFKNWFFLISPILYFIVAYIWLSNENYTVYHTPTEFLSVGHTMSLGVIFLACVLAVRRDRHTRLLEWTDTLSFMYVSKQSAIFFSIFFYSLIYTVLFFIAFLMTSPIYTGLWTIGVSFSIQSQVSYAVTIALGMLLATAIPNRIVYIITFCAWMFGTFFIEIFIINRFNLFYLKTFHLNQFFIDNSTPIGWARNLVETELIISQLFVLMFTLLLFTITVMIQMSRRHFSNKILPVISLVIVGIITCVSFFPYGSLWKDRLEKKATILEESLKNEEYTITTYPVDHYLLDVELVGKKELKVEATLTFSTTISEALSFTLYPFFTIENVELNGEKVEYEKDFHLITIKNGILQSDENTIHVQYSGKIDEWNTQYGQEVHYAFVKNEEIFLPSYIGWYPILGDKPLYSVVNNIDYPVLLLPREYHPKQMYHSTNQNFTLNLHGFSKDILGTFEEKHRVNDDTTQLVSTNSTGMTIFTNTNLTEKELDDSLTIIALPWEIEGFENSYEQMKGVKHYIEDWLPVQPNKSKIILMPSLRNVGITYYDTVMLDNNTILHDYSYRTISFQNNERTDLTYQQLITQNIGHFIYGKNFEQIANHYSWVENPLLPYIYQSTLLVIYKDYYEYAWTELPDIYNGNLSTLYSLGSYLGNWWDYNQGNLTIEEKIYSLLNEEVQFSDNNYDKIVYMVALAIENGQIDQVKELLRTIHLKLAQSDSYHYTYEQWLQDWNEVIGEVEPFDNR